MVSLRASAPSGCRRRNKWRDGSSPDCCDSAIEISAIVLFARSHAAQCCRATLFCATARAERETRRTVAATCLLGAVSSDLVPNRTVGVLRLLIGAQSLRRQAALPVARLLQNLPRLSLSVAPLASRASSSFRCRTSRKCSSGFRLQQATSTCLKRSRTRTRANFSPQAPKSAV